jgi:hypothetical protein
MKKRSIGVIAVLAIAGSAVRKFKKWIVGGMFALVIGAFSIFNVSLNSENELSAIYSANVEALSAGEDCGCIICKCNNCDCPKKTCTVNNGGLECAKGTDPDCDKKGVKRC